MSRAGGFLWNAMKSIESVLSPLGQREARSARVAYARPYFVILAHMRTGSNLLQRHLNQYPGIECHGELFNPQFFGRPKFKSLAGMTLRQRNRNPVAAMFRILETSRSPISGFRLFLDHNAKVLKFVLSDPFCRKVVVHRNLLETHISFEIAKITEQWMTSPKGTIKQARIDFDIVKFFLYHRQMSKLYRYVEDELQKCGQKPFTIHYTQLNQVHKINALAKFIGSPANLDELREEITRQNPLSLRAKVSNFDEMVKALCREELTDLIE
jgi:LPS sulfotransferase NodH